MGMRQIKGFNMAIGNRRKRNQPLRFLGEALAALVVVVLIALLEPAAASPLDKAMDRVFTVRTADSEDRFLGSAFLWADGTVAVTNAHVVGEAEDVRLVDRSGVEETALVIARDAVRDVAVIALPEAFAGKGAGLELAVTAPALGDEIFALGAPLGIEFSLTEGRISATARQVDIAVPLMFLQHDAALNPGSSGGPLVDRDGRLLGMNSQIADGSRMFVGIAYAIGAADLDLIVTGLIEETLPAFPELGLTARPVDRKVAEALGIDAAGLLVDGVEAGGLADAAGLLGGDVILGLDGNALKAPGDLAFALDRASLKGLAIFNVLRAGEGLDLTLALDQAAQAEDLRLRQVSGSMPEKVRSYRLSALGLVLDDTGLVTALTESSPALMAGLVLGDQIVTINGQSVDLATYEVTGPALILIKAPDGTTRHIHLDPWGDTDGVRPVGGANVLDPDVVVF